MTVSGNGFDLDALMELTAARNAPLHPDLAPYMSGPDDGLAFPMLRHPLVYAALPLNGMVNQQYLHKKEALAEAIADENWDRIVFLHERPYRLDAFIRYCTGWAEDEDGPLWPLVECPEHWELAADVWVDSENIEQTIGRWRELFLNGERGLWLGNPAEREQFDALPKHDHVNGPHIKAWRGGTVGDWSWTTNLKIAEFFARRSGYPVRGAMIPVSDVFGYLTRRGEAELLVKFTDFRASLVYPDKHERTTGW